MRAIALAVIFLALNMIDQEDFDKMSPVTQGIMGWSWAISFIGFWVCVIGGW